MDEYVNIIWYDENLSDQTKDILKTIHYRQFQSASIACLQRTMNDDIHDSEKILLILSGNMDHELILSTVHNERRIISIFILTDSLHISLEAYNKICGVFTNYEALEKKMLVQARILNNQAAAFDFDEKLTEKSMEEMIDNPEVGLFDMHSRFSTNRFVTPGGKEKLLKYCRRRYASNSTQLRNIDEFERTYESKDALRWYSKDCFLFSSLNKCLRKQSGNVYDCDMLCFAVDLSMQIQLEWRKHLPETEVTRIQSYLAKSVTTKGFLSTTKSSIVARMFAANVVFDIEIDPKLENIVYADISAYSHISDEEEVLIDFGTSFQVTDIMQDDDNVWIVHLMSVNEIDKLIDSYIKVKKSQNEPDVMIATGLIFFGHKDRACRFLRESLNSTNDNMDKFELNCELGEIHAKSCEFMLAASCLQEAHSLCTLSDPCLNRLHSVSFWLAIMYACLNEHVKVLDYLTIQLEFPDPKPYSLPRLRSTSWNYLVTNEQSLRFDPYQIAYDHLQRCLTIYKDDENILCKIHFYLGLILLKCDREAITLQSLDESLQHFKQSERLASDQSTDFLVLYYYHMGVIYETKECYHEAKRYYCKILPILRYNRDQKEKLTLIHVRIAACYAALKKYTFSIKRYIGALQQIQMIGNSILYRKVQAHLGTAYLKANQYNKAIEQFLGITLLIDVIETSFVREIYLIIAETLLKANDVVHAMMYYSKFLDRYEDVKEYDFATWCEACERVIYMYYSKNQFGDSIMHAKKLLEIRKNNCPEYFEDIMDTQLILALCCQRKEEWHEAITYYNMAYDTIGQMMTNIFVETYDPLISGQAVLIQSMLATLSRTIENYDQAIYHAKIALETEGKRLSRHKMTLASCYDFIGWCHYKKGEYDKALDFCTIGLHLLYMCVSESDIRCCIMYHSLATIRLELGHLKQSYDYCMKAIRILA
ncbi:unnamed protein product, partial [Rotaria magnacalcarata]